MIDKKSINQRFISAVDHLISKDILENKTSIADKIGISKSKFSEILNNRMNIGIDSLALFCDTYNIKIEWMIYGRGDMQNVSNTSPVGNSGEYYKGSNLNIRTLVVATDHNGDELLKFVPTTVFAGYLKGFSDPEYVERLPTISISGWLPEGSYRGFEVKGDSMEPTYRPGDKILARYVENWYKIREMDTYVIVSREDIVIKRIGRVNQKLGVITCMSDNTIYPSYELYLDEILEVWRVEAFIRIGQSIPKTNIDDLRKEIEELKKQIGKNKD